jgi:RNA polymerase sigma-70 factor (ECF subfamily)
MRNDDRHLVRRCLAGERSAFDALYDRHAARVYHLLRRLVGSATEAEDLTQETFLTAYRALRSWRGESAFGTWLCGIAYRLCAKSHGRRAREETEPLDDAADLVASDVDPLAYCLRLEMADRIEAAITELPLFLREAFVLVKVEGLSYREAAQWLDVPIGTLQWRLWRAICLLKSSLSDLSEVSADGAVADRQVSQGGNARERPSGAIPLDPHEL